MQPENNLIERIKKSQYNFSKAYQRVAHIITSNPFLASSMTIDELAKQAHVSVATVNRFVHHCGYNGYAEFRLALRGLFNKLFEPAEKLNRATHNNVIQTVLDTLDHSMMQLAQTKTQLTENHLEQAVNLILSANNICVAGMGISALHSSFLVHNMEPFIFKKIKDITGVCGIERAFRSVSMLNENDLIIAISLPRYSKGTVELLMHAKEKNIKILVMTDCLSSPTVALADTALLAPAKHDILYGSSVAMIALIESLATALAIRIKQSATCLTKQTEYLLPYFYFNTEE